MSFPRFPGGGASIRTDDLRLIDGWGCVAKDKTWHSFNGGKSVCGAFKVPQKTVDDRHDIPTCCDSCMTNNGKDKGRCMQEDATACMFLHPPPGPMGFFEWHFYRCIKDAERAKARLTKRNMSILEALREGRLVMDIVPRDEDGTWGSLDKITEANNPFKERK